MRVLNDDCIDRFGGKAFWLSMLKGHVNVPKFTALGFSSHDDFLVHPKEILRLCDEISEDLFAVRSSASCEDGQKTSFAGMFSSYIGIPKPEVVRAVEEVLLSANSDAVKAYAKLKGIDFADIRMNVILQKYIKAIFSGVCFVIDQEITIEFLKGECAHLVDGTASPVTIRARLDTNGKFYTMGNSEKNAPPFLSKIFENLDVIRSLTQLRSFDVEWVVDETSKLYILQTRPLG